MYINASRVFVGILMQGALLREAARKGGFFYYICSLGDLSIETNINLVTLLTQMGYNAKRGN